jgi:hypothetical protein
VSKQRVAYTLLAAGAIVASVGVGMAAGAAFGLICAGALIGVIGLFLVDIS